VAAIRQFLTAASVVFTRGIPAPVFVALFGGGNDVREEVGKQYLESLSAALEEESRWKRRGQVARLPGGANLLAWECCADLFPWSADLGKPRIREWARKVLQANRDVADVVASEICRAAMRQDDRKAALAVLRTCLKEWRDTHCDGGAVAAVAQGLVLAAPVSSYVRERIEASVAGLDTSAWGDAAKACLAMAGYYRAAATGLEEGGPDFRRLLGEGPQSGGYSLAA
jgi:hypothetical protein